MQVIGNSRWVHFVQLVPEFEIIGSESGLKVKVQTGVLQENYHFINGAFPFH